jgi:hypothetical protein
MAQGMKPVPPPNLPDSEASGRLVGPPVFKTGERPIRSLAGSIPVRLRHSSDVEEANLFQRDLLPLVPSEL